jgi:hypothetical protein
MLSSDKGEISEEQAFTLGGDCGESSLLGF